MTSASLSPQNQLKTDNSLSKIHLGFMTCPSNGWSMSTLATVIRKPRQPTHLMLHLHVHCLAGCALLRKCDNFDGNGLEMITRNFPPTAIVCNPCQMLVSDSLCNWPFWHQNQCLIVSREKVVWAAYQVLAPQYSQVLPCWLQDPICLQTGATRPTRGCREFMATHMLSCTSI